MDFKKIIDISKAINYFEDAEFYSLVDEENILIKNKKDDSIWNAVIKYDENQNLIIDTKNSELVVESNKPKEFSFKEIGRTIARKILNKESDFYEEVANSIVSDSCSRKGKKKKSKKKKETKTEYTETYKSLSKENKEYVENLIKKFSKDVSEINSYVEDFLENSGFIFGEEEIKKDVFIDPIFVLENYKNKVDIRKNFFNSVEELKSFEESLQSVFEENYVPVELTKQIFEGLSLGAESGTTITKNLLRIKKENDLKFNITKLSKEIKDIYNETFEQISTANNVKIYSENLDTAFVLNPQKYKYLKFNVKEYDENSIREILEDFGYVLSRFNTMDEETFKEIVELRQIIETMYITKQIDDELIGKILESFNSKFSKQTPIVNTELAIK